MKKILFISLCIFLGTYSYARASVFINEIAWMGTTTSSTNEWIELYNDGADTVELSGWKIITNDGDLTIHLSGNISSRAYYLIERTDDGTVPNITADLVSPFGSGLSNSGENIVLKDENGNAIDTLSFSSGWPAGDNTTKDTMQKANSNWITASATPKAINSGVTQNTNTISSGTSHNGSLITALPVEKKEALKKEITPTIKISITTPKRKVLANIKTVFIPDIIGLTGEKVTYGYFVWSMGDGNAYIDKQIKKVDHTYVIPGDYAVTLSYFENMWSENTLAEVTIPIEVVSPTISTKILPDGSLEFYNEKSEDISLSNWKIRENDKIYIFPKGMVVFSGKKVILSKNVLGFSPTSQVHIMYPDGQQVLLKNEVIDEKPLMVSAVKKVYMSSSVESKDIPDNPIFQEDAPPIKNISSEGVVDLTANVIDSQKSSTNKYMVYAGIIIILMSFGTYYLFSRKDALKNKDEFDGYSLIDE